MGWERYREKTTHGRWNEDNVMRLQRTLGILQRGGGNYGMDVGKWKPVLYKIPSESCAIKIFLSNYIRHLAMQTRRIQ